MIPPDERTLAHPTVVRALEHLTSLESEGSLFEADRQHRLTLALSRLWFAIDACELNAAIIDEDWSLVSSLRRSMERSRALPKSHPRFEPDLDGEA